ncbi:MAG: HEAT repeat domain-containing protein, partial [Calditrichia bacterium]
GNHDRKIAFVLQLIEDDPPTILMPCLKKLLAHPGSDIKIQVLKILQEHQDDSLLPEIEELLNDTNFQVQLAAMQFLAKNRTIGLPLLREYAYDSSYRLRSAALLCAAWEYRNSTEFRGKCNFKKLLDDFIQRTDMSEIDEDERIFLLEIVAQVLGIVNDPRLNLFLINLLESSHLQVQKAAITAAGQTRSTRFIPKLLRVLQINALRKPAREALAEFGEDFIEWEISGENMPEKPLAIQREIPKVLAKIGSQKSVDLLFKMMPANDMKTRFESLRGLNRLRKEFPFLHFNEKEIDSNLSEEIELYAQHLLFRYAINNGSILNKSSAGEKNKKEEEAAARLLIKALDERLNYTLERIFRLLGLKYPAADIYNAFLRITSNNSDLRAHAIEMLDNLLEFNWKRRIIPLVEHSNPDELIQNLRFIPSSDIPTEEKALQMILTAKDNWLKACAVYLIGVQKRLASRNAVEQLIGHNDPLLQESAQFAMLKFNQSSAAGKNI